MQFRIRKLASAVSIACISLTHPLIAGQFEDAVAAYRVQDYRSAMLLFRSLAVDGDAEAQYNVGVLYDEGNGVDQDFAQAAKWYRRAADQGFPAAQLNLGVLHNEGLGVERDDIQAYQWCILAAAGFYDTEPEHSLMATRILDLIAAKMNRLQIEAAEKLVREWAPKIEGVANAIAPAQRSGNDRTLR